MRKHSFCNLLCHDHLDQILTPKDEWNCVLIKIRGQWIKRGKKKTLAVQGFICGYYSLDISRNHVDVLKRKYKTERNNSMVNVVTVLYKLKTFNLVFKKTF